MPNTYVIRVAKPDSVVLELVTADGKLYQCGSLADAIDARDKAQGWFKGSELKVCVLTELNNV